MTFPLWPGHADLPLMTRRILIFLASARQGGNSHLLARRAADHSGAQIDWCDLARVPLPAFADLRPDVPALSDPVLTDILGRMRQADDLVFAVPIYWYGLPAPAKLLLDHWSGYLDAPGTGFGIWIRDKRLWLMTCRADPAAEVAQPVELALRQTARWLGMGWGGALHGVADQPGEIAADESWSLAPDFLRLSSPDGS